MISPGGSAFILLGVEAALDGDGECKASLLQVSEAESGEGVFLDPLLALSYPGAITSH